MGGFAGGARDRMATLLRRGRTPGLRTAKATLAAVASYVIAARLGTSAQPVLAPLTALLVVQVTLYETVAHGLQRIGSVLAGVLVAVAVARFVGLTWWTLGLVVAVSLVLGRLLRLGPQLLEVPISAMLVLAVGGAENVAAGRVYETLIGAAAGVAVNAIIAPPLYVQPAGDAVGELADRMAEFVRELAGDLRRGWSREAADRWLAGARALGAEVSRADVTLTRAEQSARLNPRARPLREAQPRLRTALTGLEHCYVSLRNLCRGLLDRVYYVPDGDADSAYDEQARAALAAVLDTAADAIAAVVAVTSPGGAAERRPGRQEAGRQEAGRQEAGRRRVGRQQVGRQQVGRQQAGRRRAGLQPVGQRPVGQRRGAAARARAAAGQHWVDAGRVRVEARLATLRRRRDRLAELLLVDPHSDPAAWQQHGALLAAVDRLRVEVEATVRPTDRPWRPPPVTARQRAAVRRAVDARNRRASASRQRRGA